MGKKTLYVCPDCGWTLETEAHKIRCGKCRSLNLERKLLSGHLIKADADETDPSNARLIHEDRRTWVQKLSDEELHEKYRTLKLHIEEDGRLADRMDLDELDMLEAEIGSRNRGKQIASLGHPQVQAKSSYEELKQEIALVLDKEYLTPYRVNELMRMLDIALRQHGVDWKLNETQPLKPQVQMPPLFLMIYANNHCLNDDDQPTLQGMLIKARDINDAHQWAKEWEKQAVNMDMDVELQSVTTIRNIEDIMKHPEILVQTEALNRKKAN